MKMSNGKPLKYVLAYCGVRECFETHSMEQTTSAGRRSEEVEASTVVVMMRYYNSHDATACKSTSITLMNGKAIVRWSRNTQQHRLGRRTRHDVLSRFFRFHQRRNSTNLSADKRSDRRRRKNDDWTNNLHKMKSSS